MLFKPQINQLPQQSGFLLGQTINFVIPRDFPLEGFMLRIRPTLSAAAATVAPEGIFSLIKAIRLVVNDGGSSRNVINLDGMWATQRHLQYGGNLDSATLTFYANAFSTVGQKDITVPFFIPPFSIEDPVRSHFLLNLPRFNSDPVLQIQLGTQADVDTNATPTFAISALLADLVTYKRFVKVPNWQYLDTECFSSVQAYPNNAANQSYDIPVPGYHFAIGARAYASATALGDFTQNGGFSVIQALNTFERRIEPANLSKLDTYSINSDVSPNTSAAASGPQRALASGNGSTFWWDYLTDLNGAGAMTLDGVLDTNPFVNVGQGPQVIWDLAGGPGKQIIFLHDRCFGNIDAYKFIQPAKA